MLQRGRKSADVIASGFDGSLSRLKPPSTLSKRERVIFLDVVAAYNALHFQLTDMALLCRYAEAVALSDTAAKRLRTDIMRGRPSRWLSVQEKLVKLLIMLGRQLRLRPPKTKRSTGNGHTVPRSYYERMRADADA